MKLLTASVLVFLAASCLSVYAEEENVLVLTDANLAGALKKFKYLLVQFYAPWCGHCKFFATEYASAATALSAENSDVKFGKVDATIHAKIATKYKVHGYPTIIFFKNGVPSEYVGGKTSSEMINWLKQKTGPPATTLDDVK